MPAAAARLSPGRADPPGRSLGYTDYIERITVMINDLQRPLRMPAQCVSRPGQLDRSLARLSSLLCVAVADRLTFSSGRYCNSVVNSYAHRPLHFRLFLFGFQPNIYSSFIHLLNYCHEIHPTICLMCLPATNCHLPANTDWVWLYGGPAAAMRQCHLNNIHFYYYYYYYYYYPHCWKATWHMTYSSKRIMKFNDTGKVVEEWTK